MSIDRIWIGLKSAAFIIFLVYLVMNIFINWNNNRMVECTVDIIALVVIVKGAEELGKSRGRQD